VLCRSNATGKRGEVSPEVQSLVKKALRELASAPISR
jgi:hypothetical protein